MKKLAITAAAVLAAAFLGTGTAHALVPGVDIMDTEVGYGYNAAKDGIHSAHIEIKPIPKVVVGAEYRHWNHAGNEMDVYAKYKIGHLYIGAGNRNYYDRDAKLFGLVEGRANVLGPVDAYAGLKVSSEEREYKERRRPWRRPQLSLLRSIKKRLHAADCVQSFFIFLYSGNYSAVILSMSGLLSRNTLICERTS